MYHDAIRHHHGQVWKQGGLDHLLQYDGYLRKSLIDHFYEPSVTVEQLATLPGERAGRFRVGVYGSIAWIAWAANCASTCSATARPPDRACASPRKSV